MSTLSLAQLVTLAQSVGFPDPQLAAAVAMAESTGNANAYGDAEYGGSYGLWQINIPAHPEYASDPTVLYDPETNAKAAYAISSSGTDFGPWSTAWEDPVHRTGYLGPKAPVSKFYKPTPGWPTGMIFPVLIMTTVVAIFGATVGWWHLPGSDALERYARKWGTL